LLGDPTDDKQMRNLTSLSLRNLGLSNTSGLTVVQGLTSSQLQVLDLRYNPSITRVTYDALLEALKINDILNLHSVLLDDDNYCRRLELGFHRGTFVDYPRAELCFYTKLNRYGRGGILEAAPSREACLKVLVQARDDLDALYYLLQYKPYMLVC
jgi:hypothetical protein